MDFIQNIDSNSLLWIQDNLRTALFNPIFIIITTLGNAGIIWIVTSVLLLISPKTRKAGITGIVALVLCLILNNGLLKHLFNRPRPFAVLENLTILIKKPSESSFPSGHTVSSFACAICFFIRLPKKYSFSALILAALIAFSRLYVGVHYPTDVLGGMIIGLLIGILAVYATDKISGVLPKNKESANQ